jgi:prevent-host-death family protein
MAIRPFVVSVSEFRRRLGALVDDVGRHGHPLFLTQYGTVIAVVVSCEEYRARRTEE